MPPSIHQSSVSSLARCNCTAIAKALPIRSFTTTSSRPAIGPESPKFIEVPIPPQQQATDRPVVKGTLPIPRRIFRDHRVSKTSESYLAQASPLPKTPKQPINEWLAYKNRLGETRRQALRDGLKELEQRKIRQDELIAQRSRSKQGIRNYLVHKPKREDERLTNPTVLVANQKLKTSLLADPNRQARVEEKILRVQAQEQAKAEARKDALHTLYMNARHFITTEEQLNQKVEEIFTATPHGVDNLNQNIWQVHMPPSMQSMMSSAKDKNSRAIKYGGGPAATTLKRMKRIAEELTGGKMEDDKI